MKLPVQDPASLLSRVQFLASRTAALMRRDTSCYNHLTFTCTAVTMLINNLVSKKIVNSTSVQLNKLLLIERQI